MKINVCDLKKIAMGADFLGSGGGGNANILLGLSEAYLGRYGAITLLQFGELKENQLIVPLSMIGSPSVSHQKKSDITMFEAMIRRVRADFHNEEIVLMSAEIGGCNALASFAIAAKLNLPVLDADLIGRAFPKISMCAPAIRGGYLRTAYVASSTGIVVPINFNSVQELESLARKQTTQFGGSAGIATFLYRQKDLTQDRVILGSISRALQLGTSLEDTLSQSRLIATGVIKAINAKVENSFLVGSVQMIDGSKNYEIYFMNEFFNCISDGVIIAESPDLIVLLNTKTKLPIASELLEVGQEVNLIQLPAPTFWQQLENRKYVDRHAFELSL